jgi:hypothetical protein
LAAKRNSHEFRYPQQFRRISVKDLTMAGASRTRAPDSTNYVEYEEYVDFQLEKTRAIVKRTDILTTLMALAVGVIGYLLAFVVFDQWIIEGGFGYASRVALLFIVAAAVVGVLARRPRWLIGLVIVALALNLTANCRVDSALAMPVIEGKRPALSNAELANALEWKGIRFVYADYWIAYALAFESDEEVIPSVLGPNVSVGFNRYIPYAYEVSVAESPAYVFLAGTESDAEFARRMQAEGVTYRKDEVGPYVVYRDLRPVWRVSQ